MHTQSSTEQSRTKQKQNRAETIISELLSGINNKSSNAKLKLHQVEKIELTMIIYEREIMNTDLCSQIEKFHRNVSTIFHVRRF